MNYIRLLAAQDTRVTPGTPEHPRYTRYTPGWLTWAQTPLSCNSSAPTPATYLPSHQVAHVAFVASPFQRHVAWTNTPQVDLKRELIVIRTLSPINLIFFPKTLHGIGFVGFPDSVLTVVQIHAIKDSLSLSFSAASTVPFITRCIYKVT